MSTVPPTSLQRYHAFPYKPDGGTPLLGLLLTVLLTFGAAVAIGALVSIVHQWVYLVFFFPLFMGLGVGYMGAKGIKLGKVRHPWVAALLGAMGGVLVMLVFHIGDYLLVLQAVNQNAPAGQAQDQGFSFLTYMDMQAKEGVTIGRIGRGNDKGLNLGYVGSYVYWGAEMLLAACLAGLWMKSASNEPFCTTCHSWKPGQALGIVTVQKEVVKEIMNNGDLPRLSQEIKGGSLTGSSQVLFTAYACPECGNQSTVEIGLREVVFEKKGNRKDKSEIGTWSFPIEALPTWMSLFAVPTENQG